MVYVGSHSNTQSLQGGIASAQGNEAQQKNNLFKKSETANTI